MIRLDTITCTKLNNEEYHSRYFFLIFEGKQARNIFHILSAMIVVKNKELFDMKRYCQKLILEKGGD